MIALHGLSFARHAVDHEDAVAGATLEAVGQQHDEAEGHDGDEDPDHGEPEVGPLEHVFGGSEEERSHCVGPCVGEVDSVENLASRAASAPRLFIHGVRG